MEITYEYVTDGEYDDIYADQIHLRGKLKQTS